MQHPDTPTEVRWVIVVETMTRGVIQFHQFPLCWHPRFLRSCGCSVRQWYCCTSSAAPLYKNPSLFAFLVHHPWRILKESSNINWQNTETTYMNMMNDNEWTILTIPGPTVLPDERWQISLCLQTELHPHLPVHKKSMHTYVGTAMFVRTLHWFPSLFHTA